MPRTSSAADAQSVRLMTNSAATSSTSDIIASLAAFIALVTFLATAYQAYLARKHARLSVKPVISIETCTEDSNIHLTLHNMGVGPALIQQIKVSFAGGTYDFFVEKQQDSLLALIPRESKEKTPIITTTLQRGSWIPSNQKEALLEIQHQGQAPEELTEMLHGLQVFVSYQSLYEETFHADNHTS